jgi:DNA-directed RNA polymerase subunit RPC12/RpoP
MVEYKGDAIVNVDCKRCGKRSMFQPLKVEPGIKCQNCGAILALDPRHFAERDSLLLLLKDSKHVNLG